jgi:hypothetical protein
MKKKFHEENDSFRVHYLRYLVYIPLCIIYIQYIYMTALEIR